MPITEPVPTVEPTPIAVGIPSRERPATVGPTPPPEPERRRSWAVLAIALTAQTLVVLDISVVNTALPTIGHALRLGNADLQWLVTAYLLMSGGGLLLGGRISDLLPRRRVFLTGRVSPSLRCSAASPAPPSSSSPPAPPRDWAQS